MIKRRALLVYNRPQRQRSRQRQAHSCSLAVTNKAQRSDCWGSRHKSSNKVLSNALSRALHDR